MRERNAINLAIRGPIVRADLPGLYRRLCELLAGNDGAVVVCEVTDVETNAVTVDALARLALAARQNGRQVRLRGASEELLGLISLMGLEDVLSG